MAGSFDNIIRFRAPSSLVQKLRAAADRYNCLPSDVAREAVARQVERLTSPLGLSESTDPDPQQAA
jgi:hypothetical protein